MTFHSKPYTIYTVEGVKRPRRWLRITLIVTAVVVAVVGIGAATSYAWLGWLMSRTHRSPEVAAAQSVLSRTTLPLAAVGNSEELVPESPGAMDIILFGSDNRDEGEGPEEYGRSDTVMLVHIDSRANFVSVLSLPRDLRVEIPGHGAQKLNAAYAYGGPALAIETVQNLTGVDLDHYVNIDFDAFRRVTTSLGGVWVDVDRRYYHQTQAWDVEYHENLDIQAGYQRLMGEDALDFVRYRIDSNYDYGRMQRQQLFLLEAKRQFVSFATALKVPQLASLVADNMSTTLTASDVVNLAIWGLRLDGRRVKQISLEGDSQQIDGLWYVLISESELEAAVRDYRTVPIDSGAGTATTRTANPAVSDAGDSVVSPLSKEQASLEGVKVEVLNGNGRTGHAATAAGMLRGVGADVLMVGDATEMQDETSVSYPSGRQGEAEAVVRALGTGGVILDAGLNHIKVILGYDFRAEFNKVTCPGPSGIIYEDEYKALQSMVTFKLLGPGYMPPDYEYNDCRVYEIDAGKNKHFPAVKTIYKWGSLDQYLGIMQTTFVDAPIAVGGEQVEIGGTTYNIVSIAEATDYIWWKKNGALYWVSNTLSNLLSRDELLRVATNMIPVP